MIKNQKYNALTPYLQKQSRYPKLITTPPHPALSLVVVIPCFNEKTILQSLDALKKCKIENFAVEVIVLINDAENTAAQIKNQNQQTFYEADNWARTNNASQLHFHILYQKNLPKKHAGVGLARKIGMDEAVRRLESVSRANGVIICFDADSKCRADYFMAIAKHFREKPDTQAAGIPFEHPLEGNEFAPEVYQAILTYELHLRYFIHAQKYAGFPHAVQTIGSSMAVRCDAYQKQGGMNRRKAGEDFYFIHKFTAIGKHSEIKNTVVYPSPRISNRVPFGTGKAVGEILQQQDHFKTYAPRSFEDLKIFLEKVEVLFTIKQAQLEAFLDTLPVSVRKFLIQSNFESKLLEIQKNSTNLRNFSNRFYQWFNAFLLMKFVHFARDHYYPNVEITVASEWLVEQVYHHESKTLKEQLFFLRKLDRGVNL